MGVSVVVNEQSWRLGLWQGRHSVQRGVPAGATLTRTSLSIPVDLRGRSAGLRRGSPHRRLTRPVTRGLMLGWLAGCGAAVMVGGGWGLTRREGNYSKDKDYTVISPHSTLMKRAG